jgi:hypothetical protein
MLEDVVCSLPSDPLKLIRVSGGDEVNDEDKGHQPIEMVESSCEGGTKMKGAIRVEFIVGCEFSVSQVLYSGIYQMSQHSMIMAFINSIQETAIST